MYKLLIVDDEYVEIEALTYIIQNSSLPINEIFTACNGRQAIQMAKENAPDIILMDIKMPGITGIEAATIIMDMYPKCKIVFLTAYNYFDYAQEALRLKANDFLIKPVSNETLIKIITRLIATAEKETNQLQLSASIEDQFHQISTLFENELINYLLFADVKEQQLCEYFSALNCKPTHLQTIVVTIDENHLNTLSSLKSTMIKRRCIKIFKEHLSPLTDRCFGNDHKNCLYLLVSSTQPIREDQAKSLLLSAQQTIQSNFYIECKIVISDAFEDVMNINYVFLSHKQALLFNQSDSILVYPNITYKTSNRFSSKKEHMLLESILLDKSTMTLAIATEFTNYLRYADFSLPELKYELFGMIAYIIKSLKIDHETITSQLDLLYSNYIKKSEDSDTMEALFSCFSDQLALISHALSQDDGQLDSPIIMKLCHYITANYMHDLSLKALADDLNMNSQYISKHFKDKKGITFSDYLTDIRINEAKSLLTNTSDTIQAIGLSVGYKDPNYFTRVFRKHEAITPKQYRTKTIKHNIDGSN